jgi:hypothetical protein
MSTEKIRVTLAPATVQVGAVPGKTPGSVRFYVAFLGDDGIERFRWSEEMPMSCSFNVTVASIGLDCFLSDG